MMTTLSVGHSHRDLPAHVRAELA